MKRAFALLLLGLFICAVSHPVHAGLIFPISASSDAIKGKAVDSATGKPLAGVLVIATWHDFTTGSGPGFMHQGGGVYYSCYQLVNVLTTVSDADGNYAFPAWKGMPAHCQHMAVNQPYLVYYKPGYESIDTAEVPLDKAYVPGPDHTKSEYDGSTVRMLPVSPHAFVRVDSQVMVLSNFGSHLAQAFGQDQKGPCFAKEENVALLMFAQEQRRLSKYTAEGDLGLDKTHFVGGNCSTPEAVAALMKQADAVVPEEPILPYVRPSQTQDWQHPIGEASPEPDVLRDYILEERAPGHADDEKAVIYHVDVNPANPYFLAIVMVGGPMEVRTNEGYVSMPDPRAQANSGIFGYACPVYRDIPILHQPTMQQPAPSGLDRYCFWTVALSPCGELGLDVYHFESRIWTLTEHSFARPKDDSLPSIVDIHVPDSLQVSTTLSAAGPHRWHLPRYDQPFTLLIEPLSAAAASAAPAASTH